MVSHQAQSPRSVSSQLAEALASEAVSWASSNLMGISQGLIIITVRSSVESECHSLYYVDARIRRRWSYEESQGASWRAANYALSCTY